jgi:hypothetical protein
MGTAMHDETGLRQAEHAVTPTIQSVAVRREREQSRKEHRRHCGPGGCGMLPASKPSIPWQTGSVSALPEDSVTLGSCWGRSCQCDMTGGMHPVAITHRSLHGTECLIRPQDFPAVQPAPA